ncbi:MAG: outer membrane lipoprotein-sorting protein [Candidatus Bipolaricaulota bacterium]|nr:outer membrane lipoprotein-sorting protein [Candidatus Bipolaricaulota bacterium]MCS7275088.1 outer membrane lipoprotein-sorting protein [Candidatus Bipolaricaulota bacterium]MDW8110416.1 outer membrane lipoprotein-sorting protein [Candidatus Bipolaricaulota bacterium]MDW8329732.1 outer membrane lipoprotein-sorting protein [Candidatus Bipolaricaulota bacterium]
MNAIRTVGIVLVVGLVTIAWGQQPSAQEILKKSVESSYPEQFVSVNKLENFEKGKLVSAYELRVFKKGSDKALLEVLAPEDAKGQKILRVGDDVVILFPENCRIVPLSARQNVLGTSFTVADVLRVNLVNDYNAKLLGTERVQDRLAYKLELTAKNDTVPFARILYWADTENFLPLRGEYYTETGRLLRTAIYEERKQLAGALRPSKITIENALEAGTKTVMTTLEMEIKDLPDSIFTKEALLESCKKP